MRGVLIVACTMAALTLAPPAHADVTIGSTLDATPDASLIGLATASQVGVIAPSAGVITRWRVKAGPNSSLVRLRVLRPGGNEVDASDEVTPPPSMVTLYETSISIQAGDRIALECCGDADGGIFFAMSTSSTTEIWTPPIDDDAPVPPPNPMPPSWETMINADIEPDLDGDGFVNGFDACPDLAGVPPNGCGPVAPPRVNTPAIVRFRTPLAGTEVGASQLIELDIVDDFGTPTVTVFDDDGTVCTLRGAPYSCTWRPTGADVGRATLLASAVDADNRSSLGSVRVRVARFEATLTRRVKGRRVSGKLRLPAAVEPELGCEGEVTVRRGKVRRRVDLKRNCTYKTRLPSGRGKVRARFGGNQVVAPT